MAISQWQRICRFKTCDGKIDFGEPVTGQDGTARVWVGENIWNLKPTEAVVEMKELLAPYQPSTILGIGCNYKGHAEETGLALPKYPIIFRKLPNSITGPHDDIEMHAGAGDIDWENELSFVISRDACNVLEEDALDYVLGFTVGNDVSSRYWQRKDTSGGQACYAKSFDGFCPIGPYIVSTNALPNYQDLRIVTRRNGKVMQDARTDNMLFGIKELVAFLTRGTTLPAGTLVLTGTPPGVGLYQTPSVFLQAGDVLECEIEGIGILKNRFVESKLRI